MGSYECRRAKNQRRKNIMSKKMEENKAIILNEKGHKILSLALKPQQTSNPNKPYFLTDSLYEPKHSPYIITFKGKSKATFLKELNLAIYTNIPPLLKISWLKSGLGQKGITKKQRQKQRYSIQRIKTKDLPFPQYTVPINHKISIDLANKKIRLVGKKCLPKWVDVDLAEFRKQKFQSYKRKINKLQEIHRRKSEKKGCIKQLSNKSFYIMALG